MKILAKKLILPVLIIGLIGTACDSDDSDPTDHDIMMQELEEVSAATVKYHDVQQAIADGYVDIDLFMPNMGKHFLKESLMDDKFEVDKPELLVYTPTENGGFLLTAVEYAVPVDLSPNAPEGFTGSEDKWVINTDFNLWVLHAWIWYENPDGVFNMTNSRIVP